MKMTTINEAAQLLEVPPQRLRRGIAEGRYPFLQVGRKKLVDVLEIRRILAYEARMMSVAEAAKYMGLSESTVRRAAAKGHLKCIRDGKGYRFDPIDLRPRKRDK